jgi:hypothetical protein
MEHGQLSVTAMVRMVTILVRSGVVRVIADAEGNLLGDVGVAVVMERAGTTLLAEFVMQEIDYRMKSHRKKLCVWCGAAEVMVSSSDDELLEWVQETLRLLAEDRVSDRYQTMKRSSILLALDDDHQEG